MRGDMARRLILHIGHYKTGTTALQVFCTQNPRALARAGVTYAEAQRYLNKHSDYAFALLRAAGVRRLMHGYARPEPPETLWAELIAEVRTAPTPAVLVSSEEFMRLALAPEAVARLSAILAAAPDIEVRVVAYLRPIAAHLRSWYNQLVKMRESAAGFQTALVNEIEPIHFDYALALEPWQALAAPGGLTIRAYTEELRAGDRLYRDFMAALGIGWPRRPALPATDPNPRLDDRLLDVLRMANEARLPEAARNALMARVLSRLQLNLAEAEKQAPVVAAIRARAAAGLERVAQLAGPDFPLALFRAALPEPVTEAETLRESLVQVLMRERAERAAEIRALRARIAELEAQVGRDAARS